MFTRSHFGALIIHSQMNFCCSATFPLTLPRLCLHDKYQSGIDQMVRQMTSRNYLLLTPAR